MSPMTGTEPSHYDNTISDRFDGGLSKLQKENERLTQSICDMVIERGELYTELTTLKRENEELRKAFEAEQVDCTRECDVYLETKREIDYEKRLIAAIEDFKRRCLEVVMGKWLHLDRTTQVDIKAAIESLPLTGE